MCILILYIRVTRIQRILRKGVCVKGKVDAVYKAGKWNIAEYSYTYDGKEYRFYSSKRKGLEPGKTITVMVYPDKPEKFVIKDLFDSNSTDVV